jgi:phage pi2 protein 07
MPVCDLNRTRGRQTLKIKELAEALEAAGFVSLDEKAYALGLSRSTTWTILKAKHKNYGLSAAVLNRVLRKPDLNSRVRAKIVEYVEEKAAGSYGHNASQLDRFIRRLGRKVPPSVHNKLFTPSETRHEPHSDRRRPVKLRTFHSESVTRRDQ